VTGPGSRHDEGGTHSELVTSGASTTVEIGSDHAEEPGPPTAARPGRVTSGGRLASPALQGLLALVAYLAIWVLAEALPLVLHPGWAQLDQASPDPNFYTWSLRWWPYAIAHGLNPLHTAQVGAPAGVGLAWVTTIPPLALLVFPLTALAGPVVSFNLLVVAAIPVSGWAAFVLCRRLTRRFWPSLAGGAVYGFSAYEINHIIAGQLNLAFSLLLPLMAYLVVLWWDGRIGPRAFTGLLALTMAVQFYLFIETFADLTAVWLVALLVGYAVAGRTGRPAVARLGGLVGLAYLFAFAIAIPYLAYALAHVPAGFVRPPDRTSLDLASLVVPRPTQTFGLGWLARAGVFSTSSRDGYLGIPLLVIVGWLAASGWSRKLTRFLVVMLPLLILAALGPAVKVDGHQLTGLPWARAWYLPILRSAYPVRIMVFAFLALAVIVALWLAGPARWPWARWLVALAAIAAVAANTPALTLQARTSVPAFITSGEYRNYLAPGETIVVVSGTRNAGMLWQAQTDFYPRLAGGFVNAAIEHGTDLPQPVTELAWGRKPSPRTVRDFRSFARRARLGAILVDASSAGRWPVILRGIGLRGRAVGGVIVYPTRAAR